MSENKGHDGTRGAILLLEGRARRAELLQVSAMLLSGNISEGLDSTERSDEQFAAWAVTLAEALIERVDSEVQDD